MKVRLLLFLILTGIKINTYGQITGKWKTIDDATGKARSIVEIYEQDGAYFGRIVALFREKGEDPDPICKECSDQRKDQKIIGMNIIEGIRPEGDAFMGGEILDPENGKVYKCKIWLEEGALKVRGYLYFLYRTQTWQRASE